MAVIGATRSVNNTTWDVFNTHIERVLDNSAYSAAHPDDVLFFAGPPRKSSITENATTGVGSLMAIGMIQMANISSALAVNPSKGLGSSRKFFLVDSAMHQIQISRLVLNGRNLLRAMYHVAVAANIDVGGGDIGTPASYRERDGQQFWANLDSPIYRLPVGFGFLMRDRGGTHIGGLYCELAHITNWNLSIAAGQAAIVENVGLTSDRILPYGDSKIVGALAKKFDAALASGQSITQLEKNRAGATDSLT